MNIFKKCTLIVLICLAFIRAVNAQHYTTQSDRAIKFYEKGKANATNYNFEAAEIELKKAIDIDKNFQEAHIVLAEMYWRLDTLNAAIEWYEKGLGLNPEFYIRGYYNLGRIYSSLGKYAMAAESYSKVLDLGAKSRKLISQTEKALEQAIFAEKLKNNPVPFNPVALDSNINTIDDEYWPNISADLQILVITRLVNSDHPMRQEDFFISHWEGDNWGLARNPGPPLNSLANEGAQTISADGKTMVFTICSKEGVIGKCDLYISHKSNGVWTEPENIGRPVNTEFRETQPGLSADGRTLYFSSNRPGSIGKHDIWVSKQGENGIWAIPQNLGDSINTVNDESSPFIHHDNRTLYFSSDRNLSMGGFDLYYSRSKGLNNWGKAVNLGYPINSHRDERGLVITPKGDEAYYSSDINEVNGQDIYTFELYPQARPQEVSYLKGRVFNEQNNFSVEAKFKLYDLDDGQLVGQSVSDKASGEFLICIPTNRNYMLNVEKKGFLFYSDNFSLNGIHHLDEPFMKDVPLTPIKSGGKIVLNNVFFETDSYELKSESRFELDKVIELLNANPKVNVEIGGHTDNIGTKEYNTELSKNRAHAVVQYIIKGGVDEKRLFSKGYGYSEPIDSNDTEEGRARNRRTELKIL